MFDRVMAGWDVRVLVSAGHDDRALQILGADGADLESALATGPDGQRPHALAVAADLYGCDARIREGVRQALDSGQTEVTMWGENWPADLDRSVGSVEHRLSVAARAFKAQALAAVLESPLSPAEAMATPPSSSARHPGLLLPSRRIWCCPRAEVYSSMRDRLPRALSHGFADLSLVLRGHVVGQDVQVVLVVEVEHLGDDAHADAVALAETEVDDDLAGHRTTRTGTWW